MSGRVERLGIVAYTNVAPLHWGLRPWEGVRFERGVPTELNAGLLRGDVDLTLVSSVEFVRHRDRLRALPDFGISALGRVSSVTLFHRVPWGDLGGGRIAVSTDSATSVALLETLLRDDGLDACLRPEAPDLDAMLAHADAALLIGDVALREALAARAIGGSVPLRTDLARAWFDRTRLPFTFAVWASRDDRPPSRRLVDELRAARTRGLGHLAEVAASAAGPLELDPERVQAYLAGFRYGLEAPDRLGLETFAQRVDATFEPGELRYWDL